MSIADLQEASQPAVRSASHTALDSPQAPHIEAVLQAPLTEEVHQVLHTEVQDHLPARHTAVLRAVHLTGAHRPTTTAVLTGVHHLTTAAAHIEVPHLITAEVLTGVHQAVHTEAVIPVEALSGHRAEATPEALQAEASADVRNLSYASSAGRRACVSVSYNYQ